ncbi:MAG: ABC transporter ATP-binding protein [Bacillota bacterium]
MNLLSVNNLSVEIGGQPLVTGVSFDIRKGEWLAIIGQSGSGKSVTASAIGRLLAPNLTAHGEALYNGEDLLQLAPKRMRRLRGTSISYVFQDYQGSFTPFHTIGRHFDEFLKAHFSLPKTQRRDMAERALESVGLQAAMYARYPFQLSGGQLQRSSIALALLAKPDILIADEPTAALDSISSFKVLRLLADLQQETGCAMLFITHDLRHVRKYADRIVVMKAGAVVEQGDKRAVLENPQHPYTKSLIAASPALASAADLLTREDTG